MAKLVKIVLSVILQRLILGETTLYSNLSRTILTEYARKACPFNNICFTGDMTQSVEPGLAVNTTRSTGCCTDCSCRESCGLSQNCCFPDMDRYNLVDRSHQECLVPSTYFMDIDDHGDYWSFNMVVDRYPNGNNDYCGSEEIPCGQDESATALGAMYPVFSPKTGRIYKNIQCAKCHGLLEEDVIVWKAVLMCEHDIVYFDISAAFQNIFEGKMPSNCGIRFIFPGMNGDIEREMCAFSRRQCLTGNSFEIPNELNMTHEEVRSSCMSGLQSLYIGSKPFTKNIFCDICTRKFKIRIIQCDREVLDDLYRRYQADFTALIDADIINMQTRHARHEGSDNQVLACRPQQDKQECRRVYCPTGQVTIGNGQCQFVSTKWTNNAFSVHLQLTPRYVIPESLIRTQEWRLVSGDDSNLYDSPWSKQWKIKAFLYSKTLEPQQDAFVIDYFLVRLVATLRNKHVSNVIGSIDRLLKSKWKLFVNGSTLLLDQSLSPYTIFDKNGTTNTHAPDVYGMKRILPDFALNITLPHLFDLDSLLMSDAYASNSIAVTKMFYCHQIQLDPTEYQVDKRAKLLYILSSGRILFQGEFSLTLDKNGQYVPGICVDDEELADYNIKQKPRSTGTCFRLQNKDILCYHMLVIVLCLTQ